MVSSETVQLAVSCIELRMKTLLLLKFTPIVASSDNVHGGQRLHWVTPHQHWLLHLLQHPPGDSHL